MYNSTMTVINPVIISLSILAVFFSHLLAFASQVAGPSTFFNQSRITPDDCPSILEELDNPGLQEELWNPVFNIPQELTERYGQFSRIQLCLEAKAPNLTGEETRNLDQARFFTTFLDPTPDTQYGSTLLLVDPATDRNPAIRQLRDQAGIPPPPGSFYVRFYPSRSKLPPLIQSYLSDEDIYGVTFYARYIAVLIVNSQQFSDRNQLDNETSDIFSHELVHAYLNASVPLDRLGNFPKWYQEGLAVYLSGGGRDYVYTGPSGGISRGPSDDYQKYVENFKFLENKLGKDRLLELIKISFQDANTSVLYQDLGITTENQFLSQVDEWRMSLRRRDQILTGIFIGIPLLFMVVLVILARILPEKVTCSNCQKSSKRQEYVEGHCPNCGFLMTFEQESR